MKDKSISSFGRWSTKGWEWKFRWRREWFEWEKTMVEEFMSIISQVSLYQGLEDKRLWNNPPLFSFSVKSAYNKLANPTSGGGLGVFEHLWDLKVMPSALFYMWRAFSNRNLQNRIWGEGELQWGIRYVFYAERRRRQLHTFLSRVWNQIKFGICA